MKKIIIQIIIISICLLPQINFAQNNKDVIKLNESGAIYYHDREQHWKHNWLFKTDFNFKYIQIIITDEKRIEKILVKNEVMNHSPFWFEFRINQPKLLGSDTAPTLSIPYGFSRIGHKPIGESHWFSVSGNDLLDISCNNNPIFDKSGDMLLCVIKTKNDKQIYQYTISLKYEIE